MNPDQLIEFIDRQSKPQIPITVDLWSVREIAAFLKYSEHQVRNRVTLHPSFPKAIRLPVEGSGHAKPRWKAREVIKWVEAYYGK
jgi:hypothetical protein